MAKQKKKLNPWSHDDLELKRWMLNFARGLAAKEGFENGLAAAMIYSSFSEYLAENLLENLKHFVYQGTYNQYAGVLFIDETRATPTKRTLGQNIMELERFSFPDKDGILKCLRNITEARNNMLHQFARSDMDGLKKIILQDVSTIRQETEDLVKKIDVVYAGLSRIIAPQASQGAEQETATARDIPVQE